MEKADVYTGLWWLELMIKDYLIDLGVDGTIILK